MKRFKLNVGAAAVVMGVALAVTGSAFIPKDEARASNDVGWFKTNPDGTILVPHQAVDPGSFCEGSEVYCAKEYNLVAGEPTTETDSDPIMRDQ